MPKFKPNAYGEFLSEFRKIKSREENIIYPNFEAASLAASPIWECMSPLDKEKYKILANCKKIELNKADDTQKSNLMNNMKGKTSKNCSKKTSQGKLLSEVHLEQQQIKNITTKRKKYIENFIKTCIEIDDTTLLNQPFYVIHCTSYCEDERDYYHAEIGIAKFSLGNGVSNSLRLFINHESLPAGFLHDARERCDKEHRVALPPYENQKLNPVNYQRAYYEVRDFLTTNADDGDYHLYALEDQIKPIENFFSRCAEQTRDPYIPQNYVVHNYVDLFTYLMALVNNGVKAEAVCNSFAKEVILTDTYDMLRSLACEYHYEVDALQFCALSKAKRLSHYILDEICNVLNIYMVKGLHYPQELYRNQQFGLAPQQSNNVNYENDNENTSNNNANGVAPGHSAQNNHEPRKPKTNQYHQNQPKWTSTPNTSWRHSNTATITSADQAQASTSRQGATASCMKMSRGGGSKMSTRDLNKSSSEDEFENIPHNDIAYANIVKPWESAFSAADIDPVSYEDVENPGMEQPLQNLSLNTFNQEGRTRNRFPKRKGNLAANFDNDME